MGSVGSLARRLVLQLLLTQLFSLSRAAAGGSRGRRCGVLAAGEGCEAGSELIEAARCLALICPLLRPLAFGSLARPSSPSSVQASLASVQEGGRVMREREKKKKSASYDSEEERTSGM